MTLDSQARVPLSARSVARIAQDAYLLAGQAERLDGEYDDNFRFRTADGRDFVIKAMHPGRDRSFVEMQVAALRHVAKTAPDLAISRVQRGAGSDDIHVAKDDAGAPRLVWMLDYLPGRKLAEVRPRTGALHADLGTWLGRLDRALADFEHPTAHRGDFKWDLSRAAWIRSRLDAVAGIRDRSWIESWLARFESEVEPRLRGLPHGVIHGDANDHNVLVTSARAQRSRIAGVIDFGDMHYTARVCEPAIAAAYALLDQNEPLHVIESIVSAYDREIRLDDAELEVLFTLVAMRLCVSVVNSAVRKREVPSDPYVTVSEAPAWRTLAKLSEIHPRLAHYALRAACRRVPVVPHASRVAEHLAGVDPAPVLGVDLARGKVVVLDLSIGSTLLSADPTSLTTPAVSRAIDAELAIHGATIGVGRYGESRPIYTAPLFAGVDDEAERRTVHLGLDLFAKSGTPVCAPLEGVVHSVANSKGDQDYGGVVVLAHATRDGERFFTLYGHLAPASITGLAVGREIARGEVFARLGEPHENGGWPPHLHLQLLLDDFERGHDLQGVARASDRACWMAISPDPNPLLRIPNDRFPPLALDSSRLSAARRELVLGNVKVSYRSPLAIVRGFRTRLVDDEGRSYLDVFNNVPLVGHSHPRVVAAIQRQVGLLNTNTRYLHQNLVRYAERLVAKLPSRLTVCAFLNSASEANELALRLARAHTRRRGVIVLEHAYHGNTTTLIDISPYKFDGPGGAGRKDWVHVAPIPDDYRGLHRRGVPDLGAKYAAHVEQIVERGVDVAAFIAETLPSVGGQIVLPPGYLAAAYSAVRNAGGVCIADEVQVGFGRLGSCFFGFESQGVVPDIVVFGKPIGNGFPLAAVVTTREIAASFCNGMEFFSTFGGNPVACAAGLAVLDVLEDEGLQHNALVVGDYLRSALASLASSHAIVGDVRGMGLFLGVELVRDRTTLEPATEEADYVVERLRERGILAGTDGPHHNVLKIRPALCFNREEADRFVATLDSILREDALSVDSRTA